jgi:hypothetical protein
MVESNNDEERLARMEHILDRLHREAAVNKAITAKLVLAVAALTPKVAPVRRRAS